MRTLLALGLELDVSTEPVVAPVKRGARAISVPDIDAIVRRARVQR